MNTTITDVRAFLEHIVASTNMRCLTSRIRAGRRVQLPRREPVRQIGVRGGRAGERLGGEAARGRQAGGYIRIRSKTQGIALSLGDKITLKQRAAD